MPSFLEKWGLLCVICISGFVSVLDTTIFNVSLSVIVQEFNTSVSTIQSAEIQPSRAKEEHPPQIFNFSSEPANTANSASGTQPASQISSNEDNPQIAALLHKILNLESKMRKLIISNILLTLIPATILLAACIGGWVAYKRAEPTLNRLSALQQRLTQNEVAISDISHLALRYSSQCTEAITRIALDIQLARVGDGTRQAFQSLQQNVKDLKTEINGMDTNLIVVRVSLEVLNALDSQLNKLKSVIDNPALQQAEQFVQDLRDKFVQLQTMVGARVQEWREEATKLFTAMRQDLISLRTQLEDNFTEFKTDIEATAQQVGANLSQVLSDIQNNTIQLSTFRAIADVKTELIELLTKLKSSGQSLSQEIRDSVQTSRDKWLELQTFLQIQFPDLSKDA